MRHSTFPVPANSFDTAHFWFQQQPESLYISGRRKYLKNCRFQVPATTWFWHHCSTHRFENLYISDVSNYLGICTILFTATKWNNVHFCSRQLLVTKNNSGTGTVLDNIHFCFRQLSDKLCISVPSKYLGPCTFLVPATTWDTAHACFQLQLETLYNTEPNKNFGHTTSMVSATTWHTVHPML